MSLRICWASSELTPFAKTGGLGDVSSALAAFLHRQGHDVRVFLPLYASLDRAGEELVPVDFLQHLDLEMGERRLPYSVFTARLPHNELTVYLVHCPPLYGRPTLYCGDWDEPVRFAFLTRVCLECCQRMGWSPQILHCNDWHTALAPLYTKTIYRWDRLFAATRTVLTIHNLGYQGVFPSEVLADLGLADRTSLLHQGDLRTGRVNFLKTGLLYADAVTTVSRTYAEEIQTPQHGAGLDEILRARRESVVGIVNGVDYRLWSPENDPFIPHRYSAEDLSGKELDKVHLLQQVGLPREPPAPLMGMISRLTAQKGLDLLFDTLAPLLARSGMRFVALGSGETRYEEFLHWLQSSFPAQVCFYQGFSAELAHLIEAGSDLFLMPSLYEPCGLNQMYSLRYGTVPLVRKTGGLADTVVPYDPSTDSGTGFVFEHFTPAGLGWALDFAIDTYRRHPEAWRRLMRRGMAQDFSWDRQGRSYEDLYRRLLGTAETP